MANLAIILQLLLGVAFLIIGGMKLAGAPRVKENFRHLKLSPKVRLIAGVVEVVGAVGLLAGVVSLESSIVACALLILTMIGAFFSHLRVKDPLLKVLPSLVMLALMLAIIALRWPIL